MNNLIDGLIDNSLFDGVTEYEMREIINVINYSSKNYFKGEIIAQEDDECNVLGLVVEGKVVVERLYPSGKEIIMKRLKAGDVFGEALIFSGFNKYPATVMAIENCKIIYLTKQEIIKLFAFKERFMENFLKLLSEKVFTLNSKIKSLSLKTVKQKVADYILQESIMQKTNNIKLNISKEELALNIGIPRPSLSRELIKLRDEGLIEFDRRNIKIIDGEKLEEVLFD
ncbi:MAG: Crp/Fnr family transcriptional regulator [Clostridium sp.]|uniref:Crp/Fnr family transcriptional regulator n=1 Tax=Clostridium sp. DSM 8431 TaxID=1761781 RepID=UPI0008E550D6|nr:Crp/Fnr family transcriptional regulator [Clostridium sp. DSM 8431]MCR4944225.1 Crp/Fnr family transcriptional regulator [Clostridium sp.]SFU43727.1 cAMP-binding domain of CRP or a regulatory subunit of cAMP-dependent protein kinases [Clostridium sp. DSM 8431]